VRLDGGRIREYQDERGNRIIGHPELVGSVSVTFLSENCTMEFGANARLAANVAFRRPGGHVMIGAHSIIRGNIDVGLDATVSVGDRVNNTGTMQIVIEDGATISVGDDCLFADQISLRSYDHHPIYDLQSRQRINYSRDITIGSDVWIGYGVTVMGGASIGHGSIVGTMSVVTASRPVGEHQLAVGQPAVVTRHGVAWGKQGRPPAAEMGHDAHRDCLASLSSAEP
jgi:serine acetyltransferase